MICKQCNIDKHSNEYLFIDGGLGFTDKKMEICRQCVLKHNQSLKINKYFDEQIFPQYYGAKMVISGQKMKNVCSLIDNGIEIGSNRMGIQNFLYLFGAEHGLSSYSKQMRRIYDNLKNELKIINQSNHYS